MVNYENCVFFQAFEEHEYWKIEASLIRSGLDGTINTKTFCLGRQLR